MSERNAYKEPFSQNGEYENEELQQTMATLGLTIAIDNRFEEKVVPQ